jgi:lipopolysaccharide export system protein LptC
MDIQRITTKLRSLLPLLALSALLLGSYWLSIQVLPLVSVSSEQRHDVDYVIDNLTSTTLDELGQPHQTLAAEKMWHYPDDDTTHLQMPHLTSFFSDGPPSHITAQTGTLDNKNDDIYLYNDVKVVRPSRDNMSEQQFETDYLHVAPDRDWADTDHPVLMLSKKNKISAVGMELDNRLRTVKLLSQVRATHDPVRN